MGLDRELAESANPTTDAARALRARQLSSTRSRRHLAAALRWLVKRAREPAQSPWIVTVPIDRRVLAVGLAAMLALTRVLPRHALGRLGRVTRFMRAVDPLLPGASAVRPSCEGQQRVLPSAPPVRSAPRPLPSRAPRGYASHAPRRATRVR
jgi:hypothetical protein